MSAIKIISEQTLRAKVKLDNTAIDIIDSAFATLASQQVIMPAVLSMELPMVNGEVDVKTAYVPGLETFTIKVSPGFFDNPKLGLPSLNGLMIAFCATTGLVKAVLLDNGYLTDVRTAAAGGVAARHLAPQNCQTLGVVGTGVQAHLQTLAFLAERKVEKILVWGRDNTKASDFAEKLAAETGLAVTADNSLENVVKSAQAVITTTPAQSPLIQAEWLHPGLHITAMGSDSPLKNEIAPAALAKADKVIVDRLSQSLERGELRSAVASGVNVDEANIIELSAICAKQKTGRNSEDDITICDLTGTGIQDTAIANHVLQLAKDDNKEVWGSEIETTGQA